MSSDSSSAAVVNNPITKEFRKLLDQLDIYRPGLSFYALRHTFETIAGETKDQVAVDAIMGHARDDMASVYRESISDERLQVVVKHVHDKQLNNCKGLFDEYRHLVFL